MPNVPIKKSDSGIPDKLLLAQAYHNELNALLLKRKVLNDTVRLYQERIKKLELECASDNNNNNDGADGEFVRVV